MEHSEEFKPKNTWEKIKERRGLKYMEPKMDAAADTITLDCEEYLEMIRELSKFEKAATDLKIELTEALLENHKLECRYREYVHKIRNLVEPEEGYEEEGYDW